MASIISYTKAALDSLLALKADSSHLHDDRYFTETEVTNALSGKSDSAHTHDDRYFTETELTASLAAKVNKAGDTMTGQLLIENAAVRAGTLTDVLGAALEILRNNIQIGRIDNNAGGLRIQAQAGTLQLRGSGNTGIAIDSAGVADFAVAPTVAGAPLGGAVMAQQFRAGRYYGASRRSAGTFDTFAMVPGTLYALPFIVGETTPFDRIACVVQTAEAGMVVRLGIYKSSRLVPSTLVVDAGSMSVGTTGVKEFTINTTLSPGLYWIVALTNSTNARFRASTANGDGLYLNLGQGVNDWFDGNISDSWRMTGYTATSALPATASLTGLVDGSGSARDVPIINLRAA